MWVYLNVDSQSVNYGVNNFINGTSSSPGANDWRRIGGAGVASAQDMHTVRVTFQSALALYPGTTFAVDDLQCFPTGQCAM
jgi:hypothetical protein